jgi:hypothetical protein
MVIQVKDGNAHLRGMTYPAFESFIIFGNEDAPSKVQLFEKSDPGIDDHYTEIVFNKE